MRNDIETLRSISEELSRLLKWVDAEEEANIEIANELNCLMKKEKMLNYIGNNYINLDVIDLEMVMGCRNIPDDIKKDLEAERASRSVFKESVRKDL